MPFVLGFRNWKKGLQSALRCDLQTSDRQRLAWSATTCELVVINFVLELTCLRQYASAFPNSGRKHRVGYAEVSSGAPFNESEDLELREIARCLRRLLTLVALSGIVIPLPVSAQSADLRGVVYDDANANGVRDVSEHGIAGVVVSNQRDVVVTDSLGHFDIPRGTTGILFVSVPNGFRASGKFWQPTTATATTVDFGLIRQTQSRTFTFVHASDSHISPKNVERFRHFRQLADSQDASFVLMGGDLIYDAMSQSEARSRSFFGLYATETRSFRTPIWAVPGNHDHYGIIPSSSHADPNNPLYNRGMYRQYLGPDYYSFTYGGVHFIGLNTISPDDSAYYGDVDSVQMAWLKRDLAHVKAETPVVTFNHIPLFSSWPTLTGYDEDPLVATLAKINGKGQFRHTVSNVLAVIEAMHGHRYVLALGSHMHAAEHVSYMSDGLELRSDVSAAIVGGNEFSGVTCGWMRALRAGALWDVLHVGQSGEILILGPDDPIDRTRRRINDAVREGQLVVQSHARRAQRECGIQIDDGSLLHDRHGLKGFTLAALSGDDLEHFQQTDCGHDQPPHVFDRRSKVSGTGLIREVGEPRGRVHDV